MLSSLKELGLLSARYAEEEALRAKQCVSLGSITPLVPAVSVPAVPAETDDTPKPATTSTIVSAPVPPTTAQKAANLASSSSSCSSSSSLPGSPLVVQSPPIPIPNSDNNLAVNLLPYLAAQRASLPGIDKLQQLGLGLLPVANPFVPLGPHPGLLLAAAPANYPAVRPLVPSIQTPILTAAPSYPSPPAAAPPPVFSSLQSSRVRKPFHKRRPAHMDKNMLFCHFCGRKDTPEWRKGPSGPATLCNACGLQWAKKMRAQRSSHSSSSTSKSSKNAAKAASSVSSNKSSEETSSDPETLKEES